MTTLPAMGVRRRLRRIALVAGWGTAACAALIAAPLVLIAFVRLVVFLADHLGLV